VDDGVGLVVLVADASGVSVAELVAVALPVRVPAADLVAAAVTVRAAVRAPVGVDVMLRVPLGVALADTDHVPVPLTVPLCVAEAVPDAVADAVALLVAVRDADAVLLALALVLSVALPVLVAVAVAVGLTLGRVAALRFRSRHPACGGTPESVTVTFTTSVMGSCDAGNSRSTELRLTPASSWPSPAAPSNATRPSAGHTCPVYDASAAVAVTLATENAMVWLPSGSMQSGRRTGPRGVAAATSVKMLTVPAGDAHTGGSFTSSTCTRTP
jgi:hypothetical protein